MDNKGVEFSINAVPIDTKDFTWTVGFNYTWNDSEITKLNVSDSEGSYVETGAISGTGKFVECFMVGKRPYTFYLAKQAYDENGKPIEGKYVQPDGSVSATETRYANKCALPKSYLGFNTQFSYKQWELGITGHGSFGNYIYNYIEADQYQQQVYSDQGSFYNILKVTAEKGFQQQQLYSDYFCSVATSSALTISLWVIHSRNYGTAVLLCVYRQLYRMFAHSPAILVLIRKYTQVLTEMFIHVLVPTHCLSILTSKWSQ